MRVGREIVLLGAAEHARSTPIRRYSEAEARALGLLEASAATVTLGATLESRRRPAAPKGFMNILRSKTVVK